jgi:hypothetical protein
MAYNLIFNIQSKGQKQENDKYSCKDYKDFEISVPQNISRKNNNIPKEKIIIIVLEETN